MGKDQNFFHQIEQVHSMALYISFFFYKAAGAFSIEISRIHLNSHCHVTLKRILFIILYNQLFLSFWGSARFFLLINSSMTNN